MKIGLFGGTFNPPHLGHTSLAKDFYNESEIDLLIVMPSFVPPHKDCTVDASLRYEMTCIAFSELDSYGINYTVSDYEIKKGGISYTVNTIEHLLEEYKQDTLSMCVGSDMFLSIETWKSFEKLLKMCTLYTKERISGEYDKLCSHGKMLEEKYGAKIYILKDNALEASSTYIRETDVDGNPLLSPEVEKFIVENGLYENSSSQHTELKKVREVISSFLSEKRYSHTLSVEKEALSIADYVFPALNIPEKRKNDIRLAAILHDVAKEKSAHEQLELCKKYKIKINEPPCFPVLHGKTGAHLAKELFGINDTVFSAIFNHTTGCENMNVFEKIIFLADYIEPTRKAQSCIDVRNFFYSSLDKTGRNNAPYILDEAVKKALHETLNYLAVSGNPIDTETVKAYEYLKNNSNPNPPHFTKE